jgi:hypothetical protein
VNAQEGSFPAGFHQTIAAPVFGVFQQNGMAPGLALHGGKQIGPEYAPHPHGSDKNRVRPAPAQDISHVIGAAAHAELLALGVHVFLRPGQMIHPDDHVHAGGTDNEYAFSHGKELLF